MPEPTPEQEAAATAFGKGDDLALQAGAGTGKTTTLAMMANRTRRRGLYVAFNRAIADAARRTFPSSTQCRTAHALAFRAIGRHYAERMNPARTPSWKTGQALGIAANMVVSIGERKVTNKALSTAALHTVTRYCQSADQEIARHHVPQLRGLEAEHLHADLTDVVLPYARKAWADLQNPEGGTVPFGHDHYLKMWALTDPLLPTDFLLLDEAQDTNPVVEKVVNDQRSHAQLVMVGDSAQAIYGWRGARDVMSGFDGTHLGLSQSFRFGPDLAREANRWLGIVEAPIRLRGAPGMDSALAEMDRPEAILCRTNFGAMAEVMALLDEGKKVALVGGGGALEKIAHAAQALKEGKRSWHPELMLFETWGDLQDYAEYDPAGHDLLPLVDLVDEHGTDVLLAAIARLSEEDSAEIVVSTAHKAKGREWATVRIGADFAETEPEDEEGDDGQLHWGPIDTAEARLAYVAVTRARHQLDAGGLSWINDRPEGQQEALR